MSGVRITTNFNIDIEFEAAPFYKRLLAWLGDSILLILCAILALKFLNGLRDAFPREVRIILQVIFIVVFACYHLICEIFMNGQSVGKRIMGIRVVNENGGQPGIGQYIIRWLIRTSDFMILIIIFSVPQAVESGDAGLIWKIGTGVGLLVTDVILVNSKKYQRLGDILAHTLLITTRSRESINDTIFLDVAGNYVPSFPQVMQLSDRDINSLKGILDTARRRHDYSLAEMASEKIKAHLKINTPLSPFDFLEVLLKDYNYLSTN